MLSSVSSRKRVRVTEDASRISIEIGEVADGEETPQDKARRVALAAAALETGILTLFKEAEVGGGEHLVEAAFAPLRAAASSPPPTVHERMLECIRKYEELAEHLEASTEFSGISKDVRDLLGSMHKMAKVSAFPVDAERPMQEAMIEAWQNAYEIIVAKTQGTDVAAPLWRDGLRTAIIANRLGDVPQAFEQLKKAAGQVRAGLYRARFLAHMDSTSASGVDELLENAIEAVRRDIDAVQKVAR